MAEAGSYKVLVSGASSQMVAEMLYVWRWNRQYSNDLKNWFRIFVWKRIFEIKNCYLDTLLSSLLDKFSTFKPSTFVVLFRFYLGEMSNKSCSASSTIFSSCLEEVSPGPIAHFHRHNLSHKYRFKDGAEFTRSRGKSESKKIRQLFFLVFCSHFVRPTASRGERQNFSESLTIPRWMRKRKKERKTFPRKNFGWWCKNCRRRSAQRSWEKKGKNVSRSIN